MQNVSLLTTLKEPCTRRPRVDRLIDINFLSHVSELLNVHAAFLYAVFFNVISHNKTIQ